MRLAISTIGVAMLSMSAASQTVSYFPSIAASGLDEDPARVESRFRADTTNWNLRLEEGSFPVVNEPSQLNTGNGRALYENQTFAIEFRHEFTMDGSRFVWSVERDDGVVSGSVMLDAQSDFAPNSIKIFTNGERGSVSIADLQFEGFGITANGFGNLDVQPNADGGPNFRETVAFFGLGFDLLADEWTLSGLMTFGTFTTSNPSEASKFTVKLQTLIPAPGSAALLAMGGLVLTRRRR